MKIELSSGLMKFVTGPFEEGAHAGVINPEIDRERFEQLMAPLFVGLVRLGKLEEYLEVSSFLESSSHWCLFLTTFWPTELSRFISAQGEANYQKQGCGDDRRALCEL